MGCTGVAEKIDEKTVLRMRDALGSRAFLLLALAFTVVVIAAYKPALFFWWGKWFEPESYYSHGPFVAGGSVYAVWFNRRRISRQRVEPSAAGYMVMVAAGMAGWLAWMGASASVMGFTLPAFVAGAVMAVFGTGILRALAFPLAFLYFTAVLPESVLNGFGYRAQLWSTEAAAACLNLVGIQAVARGAFIELSNFTVEIASACSGFRLVISMLAISTFLAYVRRGPVWGKLALIALSPILAFTVNTARISLVSLVGSIGGQNALKQTHDITGYLVLLAGAALLLVAARLVKCGNYRQMPL